MPAFGDQLPRLVTPIPGPASRGWVDRLARRECPAITARRARRAEALGVADTDPVVWARARGANVEDADGNVFVDLTAGFGVASVGHGHPAITGAVTAQLGRLVHAMGDAFPDPQRIRLLEALAERSGLDRAILGSSGSDAVEAALKTARMATGRDPVVAFTGGYHGLSFGALAALGYKRGAFQGPFAGQVGGHVRLAPYGGALPDLSDVGAVLVEPIQGRGGIRVPPEGWLARLVTAAHAAGAVVIFDEIYTGCGRTGDWFRFQADGLLPPGVRPDLVCVGKGLAGGFPISACLGTAAVMDAWGASRGESLHTQTFLGHPVSCTAALACLEVLDGVLADVPPRGAALRARLEALGLPVRGVGMLLGVEVPDPLGASRRLLERGYLVLPAGDAASPGEGVPGGMVLALTPPLTLSDAQAAGFIDALAVALEGG